MSDHDDELSRALGRAVRMLPTADTEAALARVGARSRVVRRRRVATRVGLMAAAVGAAGALWIMVHPTGSTRVDTVDTATIPSFDRVDGAVDPRVDHPDHPDHPDHGSLHSASVGGGELGPFGHAHDPGRRAVERAGVGLQPAGVESAGDVAASTLDREVHLRRPGRLRHGSGRRGQPGPRRGAAGFGLCRRGAAQHVDRGRGPLRRSGRPDAGPRPPAGRTALARGAGGAVVLRLRVRVRLERRLRRLVWLRLVGAGRLSGLSPLGSGRRARVGFGSGPAARAPWRGGSRPSPGAPRRRRGSTRPAAPWPRAG